MTSRDELKGDEDTEDEDQEEIGSKAQNRHKKGGGRKNNEKSLTGKEGLIVEKSEAPMHRGKVSALQLGFNRSLINYSQI